MQNSVMQSSGHWNNMDTMVKTGNHECEDKSFQTFTLAAGFHWWSRPVHRPV